MVGCLQRKMTVDEIAAGSDRHIGVMNRMIRNASEIHQYAYNNPFPETAAVIGDNWIYLSGRENSIYVEDKNGSESTVNQVLDYLLKNTSGADIALFPTAQHIMKDIKAVIDNKRLNNDIYEGSYKGREVVLFSSIKYSLTMIQASDDKSVRRKIKKEPVLASQ